MVPSPGPNPGDDPPDRTNDGGSVERDGWARVDEEGSAAQSGAGPGSGSVDGTEPSPPAADEQPAASDSGDGESGSFEGRELAMSLLRRVLAVFTAFFLGGIGFLVGLPLILLASLALFFLGLDSPAARLVVGVIALQGVAFPTVALGYLGFRYGLAALLDREFDSRFVRLKFPSLVDVGATVLGFIGVVGLVFGSLVVVSLLNAPTAERSDSEVLFQNPELLLVMIPVSFLLIGPGEELLFRGIIQDRLREAFGPVGAILLASAAFAPLHVFALSGGIQALAITIGILFVPSLVFGATYELTDNLLVPIVIHGAYDALIFGSMYITVVFAIS